MISRKLRESDKKIIASAQEWKCNLCLRLLSSTYQIDHIIPLSVSEDDSYENLQALCSNCHSSKTQKEGNRIYQFKKLSAILNAELCWYCLETSATSHRECSLTKILKPVKMPAVKCKKMNILDKYYYTSDNMADTTDDMMKDESIYEVVEPKTDVDVDMITEQFEELKVENILRIQLFPDGYCLNRTHFYSPVDYNVDEIIRTVVNLYIEDRNKYTSVEIEINCDQLETSPEDLIGHIHQYLPDKMPSYLFYDSVNDSVNGSVNDSDLNKDTKFTYICF